MINCHMKFVSFNLFQRLTSGLSNVEGTQKSWRNPKLQLVYVLFPSLLEVMSL